MRFWWGGTKSKKPFYWRKWSVVSKCKADGGIGFRNFLHFNEVLMAKQSWRLLINHSSYWASFIKAIYYPNCNFLEVKIGSRPSQFWSSAIKGRNFLVKGARLNVGNGENNAIWNDSNSNFYTSSPRPEGSNVFKVADLIIASSKQWHTNRVQSLFSGEEGLYYPFHYDPYWVTRDKWVWHPSPLGRFTVKLAYRLALASKESYSKHVASSSFCPSKKFWSSIWSLKVQPKLKHFWWKVCNNSLPTKENLWQRKCAPNPLCSMCRVEAKTFNL